MQKQIFDLMKSYNDSVMASAKRLGELNLKTCEMLVGKQAEMFSQCAESATGHLEKLVQQTDFNQAVEAQLAFAQTCTAKMVANLRDYTGLLTETRDELSAITEEATTELVEKMEQAGELLKEAA